MNEQFGSNEKSDPHIVQGDKKYLNTFKSKIRILVEVKIENAVLTCLYINFTKKSCKTPCTSAYTHVPSPARVAETSVFPAKLESLCGFWLFSLFGHVPFLHKREREPKPIN